MVTTDYLTNVSDSTFTLDVTPSTFGGGEGVSGFDTVLTHTYVVFSF